MSPIFTTQELSHGRIEQRSIQVAPLKINETNFPGACSIAIITRACEDKKTGKTRTEQVPYIASLIEPTPEQFLFVARQHWAIENSTHNVLDTTFREDRHTMHTKNGPLNMTLFRKFAISFANLLNMNPISEAIRIFDKNSEKILNSFNFNRNLEAL